MKSLAHRSPAPNALLGRRLLFWCSSAAGDAVSDAGCPVAQNWSGANVTWWVAMCGAGAEEGRDGGALRLSARSGGVAAWHCASAVLSSAGVTRALALASVSSGAAAAGSPPRASAWGD